MCRKKPFFRIATLLLCFGAFACSAQTNDAWDALFNGEDLDGWVPMHGAKFVVTNSCLRLETGMGWLRTEKAYDNFVFELEWRALMPGYDSGIFLRASGDAKPWPEHTWQVNMSHSAIGALMKGTRTIVPAENPPAPVNTWTQFRITANGNTLSLNVNNEPAWTFERLEASRGSIGIQAENRPFEFRNIRIRELP